MRICKYIQIYQTPNINFRKFTSVVTNYPYEKRLSFRLEAYVFENHCFTKQKIQYSISFNC